MKDESQRPVPRQRMQIDGLPVAHRGREADDGKDGGQADEESENALCLGGAETGNQNLQRGAQQKRTWSHQYEGCCVHAFMLSVRALERM